MKTCEYCNKEISYNDMHCCTECEENAKTYYIKKERFSSFFGIINIICLFGTTAGIFFFGINNKIGGYIISTCAFILGLLFFVLPFPAENMIDKWKIKKSIFITKFIGIAFLIFSLSVLIFTVLI